VEVIPLLTDIEEEPLRAKTELMKLVVLVEICLPEATVILLLENVSIALLRVRLALTWSESLSRVPLFRVRAALMETLLLSILVRPLLKFIDALNATVSP